MLGSPRKGIRANGLHALTTDYLSRWQNLAVSPIEMIPLSITLQTAIYGDEWLLSLVLLVHKPEYNRLDEIRACKVCKCAFEFILVKIAVALAYRIRTCHVHVVETMLFQMLVISSELFMESQCYEICVTSRLQSSP